MPAKYVLAQKGSSFHWNLLATNGRVIASSEVYNSKAAAMAGIRSVQKNGATDVVVSAEELAGSRTAAKKGAKKVTKAPAKAVKAAKAAVKAPGKAPAKAVKAAAKKVTKAPARPTAAKRRGRTTAV